jgi:hypothetical protein
MKTYLAWLVALTGLVLAGCVAPPPHAETPYTAPLNSPGAKFSGLPPAAQNSIRSEAGGSEIYDIVKNVSPNLVVYEVIFKNWQRLPPLYVASDGSVLNPGTLDVAVGAPEEPIGAISGGPVSGVRPGDLPSKVMATVQEKAPTAEIAFINKVRVGDAVLYEVSFKDQRPEMVLSEEGVLVKR